jgi:deoxyadenosine/deoxycytidine kinase
VIDEKPPQLIAVEGPIGVGKKALCHKIAESVGYDVFLETPEVNPFLPRFYQDRKQAAFQTQLHFLLERARKVQELRQHDLFTPQLITNFIIEKDRIYAEVNLDQDELALYLNVYDHLTIERPEPDLVIYLQAQSTWLTERLQSRFEEGIDPDYVAQVTEAYTRFFHFYDQAPLIIVNVSNLDLENSERDLEGLLKFVKSTRLGRHYYNPEGSII